ALSTVLGGKAGPALIRNDAEKAQIEACFSATPETIAFLKHEQLLDEDTDELVVFRELSRSGSRSRVNGTLVNQSILQDLRDLLITIHAQHEARTLMSPSTQLAMLDGLGEAAHKKLLDKVRREYAVKKDLSARLEELNISETERIKRLQFSRFQLHE